MQAIGIHEKKSEQELFQLLVGKWIEAQTGVEMEHTLSGLSFA